MKKTIYSILLLFISLQIKAGIYTVDNIPSPYKIQNNYVSNPDNIISETTVNEINQYFQSLEEINTAEAVVVLVQSIGDENTEEFANKLFNKWGIGKKEEDNGLLILFVLDQRTIRFETGYGIEGDLPDVLCKRIQRDEMIPFFKTEDYDTGMKNGVIAVYNVLKTGVYNHAETIPKTKNNFWSFISNFYPLFIFFFIVIFIGAIIFRFSWNKYKNKDNDIRYKNLKTTSFIFFFLSIWFFPLVFLGIYALIKANIERKKPRSCPHCNNKMNFIPNNEKSKYLSDSKQFEEKIKSVRYDVWKCNHCNYEENILYKKSSRYISCNKCGVRAAYITSKKTIKRPSYSSIGKGEQKYKCKHCGYEWIQSYPIAKLSSDSGSFGSSDSGSSGSGSSSGSSSSDSGGGGSSGGGGASSSW